MSDITGATDITGSTDITVDGRDAVGRSAGTTEEKVLDAVVACAGRWGIDKTTVDDVAREAGVSRATVYRLFPGGKTAMVHLSTSRAAVTMLVEMTRRVEGSRSLPEALVELLTSGTEILTDQPAIAYMRAQEPATLRRFFSFQHLDRLLMLTADVLGPALHRFLEPQAARETVTWLARLVISYFLNPDPDHDLRDRSVATALVADHLVPGLRSEIAVPPRQLSMSTP